MLDTHEIIPEDSDTEILVTDSDSEDEDSYYYMIQHDSDEMVDETPTNAPEVQPSPVPLRRSTRTTAGKHSNVHHLPKSSVCVQSVALQNRNFQELGNAVANLGATLASKLNEAWTQS